MSNAATCPEESPDRLPYVWKPSCSHQTVFGTFSVCPLEAPAYERSTPGQALSEQLVAGRQRTQHLLLCAHLRKRQTFA